MSLCKHKAKKLPAQWTLVLFKKMQCLQFCYAMCYAMCNLAIQQNCKLYFCLQYLLYSACTSKCNYRYHFKWGQYEYIWRWLLTTYTNNTALLSFRWHTWWQWQQIQKQYRAITNSRTLQQCTWDIKQQSWSQSKNCWKASMSTGASRK